MLLHSATDVPLFMLQMGPYPSYPPTQAGQSQPYPMPSAQPSYALPQPKQPPLYPSQQPSYYPAQPPSRPPPGVPHPPTSHEMGHVTARMGAATVEDPTPAYQVSDDCVGICDRERERRKRESHVWVMCKCQLMRKCQCHRITLQPPKTEGTVKDHQPFDAEADAKVIREAMKGWGKMGPFSACYALLTTFAFLCHLGTDEKAIINVLAYRSNQQRQRIKQTFKSRYGKVSYNHILPIMKR